MLRYAIVSLIAASIASAQGGFLDTAKEPSPFVPDAARWIGQPDSPAGWAHHIRFRRALDMPDTPRRAIVAVSPSQYIELRIDGALLSTGCDRHEALPVFVDVTGALAAGSHEVTVDVRSEWRPQLYLQLRAEHADGRFEDIVSDASWEVCPVSDEGAAGDFVSATDSGGYHRTPGASWIGVEFALLPREQVREHLDAHNQTLRKQWESDREGPFSEFRARYEQPGLEERYAEFCRLDRRTGQLLDAQGREIHLFFTIYDQQSADGSAMSIADFDYDQLERDLDLMAAAHVNPYMRQMGWDRLLDGRGEWQPCEKQPKGSDLPKFALMRDIWDYFLDRVQAHGLHVVLEADFYWSANPDVIYAPYRSRYHIYPEALEAEALATRKIMNYFSKRPCVLGAMAGEEDILLAHDLTNPHLRALYSEHIRAKYGDIATFIASHPGGYDCSAPTGLRRVERQPEFIPGVTKDAVMAPSFVWKAGLFDGLRSLDDVPLPTWPPYMTEENPEVAARGHRSYNDFTPDDPLWIDYYETVEEHLLFDMLCRWATIVREGCPNQLLFYSNAQDMTTSWHFLHLLRRSDLPFDVIGVGCHDSTFSCAELEPWATTRKTIKVVAAYRPYVNANGALPLGIASGEGEGGKEPEDILNYYRGALFDEIGGGAAWTQTYTWTHISGGRDGGKPHETPLVKWMGEFLSAHEHDPFPLAREVPVLILGNDNLQHSNRSGLDYGNALELAHELTQLNIDFDIAMASALTRGTDERFRIDVDRYRLILLPSVACDLPTDVWRTLGRWVTDTTHPEGRTLVVGLAEGRTAYMAPADGFPAALQRLLGRTDYDGRSTIGGPQAVRVGDQEFTVTFGPGTPIGVLSGDDVVLTLADGRGLAVAREYGGNRVLAVGFPLGLNTNDLWAVPPKQEPYDAYASLLDLLVTESGVPRPIVAPHNVRVYPSADGRTLLIRERYNMPTQAHIEVTLPEGVFYAEGILLPNGRTVIDIPLGAYEGIALSAVQ